MGLGASSRSVNDAEIASYFEGTAIWITGASSGLGEALSISLCALSRPRSLVLSARRVKELERVQKRCKQIQPGIDVHVLPVDLAAVDGLQEAAKKANALVSGHIEILVNNGGVGFRGLVQDTSFATHQNIMNVDYLSGVALVTALLPGWRAAHCGHVVQIASIQSFFGLPGRSAYAAAKHAAVGFYDALRAEVADEGVAVTTVAPGYIRTGHSFNALKADGSKYEKLDESTQKGVDPEVLAPQLLTAVARREAEFTPAPLDARFARILRTLWPRAFFSLMVKRARKDRTHFSELT